MRMRFLTVVVAAMSVFLGSEGGSASIDTKQAELEQIRGRIDTIRKAIQADAVRRDALAEQLRRAELQVQTARQQLARARTERSASEQQLRQLQAEQAEAQRQIATQRTVLVQQLRAAYVNGHQEPLKVLLNQTDPVRLGRALTYYGYLARARAERLTEISERFEHLSALGEGINTKTLELKALEAQSAREVDRLAAARKQRAQTLDLIKASLNSRNDELAKLEREGSALEKLITELRRAIEEFPPANGEPFARSKGKLPWPVRGELLARFGEPRAGGPLKWQGWLIGAERGTQVRAPYPGRVVYADWLPGLGLLLVLDHGGGYISLYGHNEQLYRRVGEQVVGGDALAAVGEAAGIGRPALYFEIRYGRQPQDPAAWLKAPAN